VPRTRVVFYKNDNGSVPLLEWLAALQPQAAVAKCIALIELLKAKGHELRRPHADYLRDGIYELRARLKKVRIRMLYFFHEKTAVLTHGFVKKSDKVPPGEIDGAIEFRESYEADPEGHTHEEG
jgi:phage-related protein